MEKPKFVSDPVSGRNVINCDIKESDASVFLPNVHVSRGEILSGVLQGTCGYESVPIRTDAPVSDNEPQIDYDPANDQRLDRFDAVEMGIEEIDKKTPTQLPDGQIEPEPEKKE